MRASNDNAATGVAGGLRFLSVCSGIEAASVAWNPIGWEAVAFSEIEKFPSAVLAHHYPDVPNLGDFTAIDTTTLGPVDILCGGTPCQAFSIAGLRGSLDDARGNLTLSFVKLAHELANGNGLRNVVWENVLGVLSTKDNAFGCFLGALVGADDALPPPAGRRWPNAGMVAGPKGRAAWRILDAQYFGLAQRRKRVILVADFGSGADPAAVLFERTGLQGNPTPRREAGEVAAGAIEGGAGVGGVPEVAGTMKSCAKSGGFSNSVDHAAAGYMVPSVVDVAPTLRAGGNATGGDRPYGTDVDTADSLVAYAPEIARCVATREGSSQDYETTTMVAQTVAIRGRDGGATAELGGEVATALRASQGGGDKPHVLAFQSRASASQSMNPSDITPTLDKGKSEGMAAAIGSAVRRLTPRECERLMGFPDDYTAVPYGHVSAKKLEDDYVKYMGRGNPKGLTRDEVARLASDGPRYKALGNSWAVPKFRWLGERIAARMPNKNMSDAA